MFFVFENKIRKQFHFLCKQFLYSFNGKLSDDCRFFGSTQLHWLVSQFCENFSLKLLLHLQQKVRWKNIFFNLKRKLNYHCFSILSFLLYLIVCLIVLLYRFDLSNQDLLVYLCYLPFFQRMPCWLNVKKITKITFSYFGQLLYSIFFPNHDDCATC